jgi:peptide/nickel transport system permease protein
VLRLIARRLALAPVLVVAVATIVFIAAHLLPGDVVGAAVTSDTDPEWAARQRAALGLDRPLHEQYAQWLRAFVLRADLGTSFVWRRPVRDLLAEAIPNTLRLTVLALVARWILGLGLGLVAAVRHRQRSDLGLRTGALVLDALPAFWLAVMAQLVFAYRLRWFPADAMQSLDAASMSGWARAGDALAHAVLPVAVLTLAGVAPTLRWVRAGVLETLGSDFVRAARARGLAERAVVTGHALRAALPPLVTLLGLSLPGLVGGALVVETIFAWPGMGRLAFLAANNRDVPVLLATTSLAAALVVLGNLGAEVASAALDPRQRPGRQR